MPETATRELPETGDLAKVLRRVTDLGHNAVGYSATNLASFRSEAFAT